MKSFTVALLSAVLFFSLSGCSGKAQINPDSSEWNKQQDAFDLAKEKEKEKQAWIKEGEAKGYARAKQEVEALLPYFEAIRASAQVNDAGGLCLPPLFIDKSSKNGVTILLGDAHLCEEYTVDDILAMAENGIPGLPVAKNSQESQAQQQGGFVAPSISVVGQDDLFFTKRPAEKEQTTVRYIASTQVNREFLRNSSFDYSNVEQRETDSGNYLVVTFTTAADAQNFCQQHTICEGL